jgi:hypothetical protein
MPFEVANLTTALASSAVLGWATAAWNRVSLGIKTVLITYSRLDTGQTPSFETLVISIISRE